METFERAVLVCIFLFASTCKASESDKFRIFYIPLDVNFYSPVTPENIEELAFYSFDFTSTKVGNLFVSIKKYKGARVTGDDLSGIRVKIVNIRDGGVIFITAEKGVFSGGEKYDMETNIINAALNDIDKYSKKIKKRY